MYTITVFNISLIVVLLFLFVKTLEIKYKKQSIASRFRDKLDVLSQKLISNLKFKWLQFIQSLQYIILIKAKILFKNVLVKIEAKIMNEYHAKQNTIMGGQRNISNRGSVSFYLKKISEGKTTSGKIE
ncbi:MAG: hypothetical protein JW740_03025 [Candidatus Zambryskibacteria bacterium]|nr:hypothetical protein [Candidatus Zambryskibacteria bacterium]